MCEFHTKGFVSGPREIYTTLGVQSYLSHHGGTNAGQGEEYLTAPLLGAGEPKDSGCGFQNLLKKKRLDVKEEKKVQGHVLSLDLETDY